MPLGQIKSQGEDPPPAETKQSTYFQHMGLLRLQLNNLFVFLVVMEKATNYFTFLISSLRKH